MLCKPLFFFVPICRGCGSLLQGACFKRFPKRRCLGSVCPRTGCRCASWCASVLPYSPVLPEFAFSNAPVVQSRAPPFVLWGGMCPFCVAQKRHMLEHQPAFSSWVWPAGGAHSQRTCFCCCCHPHFGAVLELPGRQGRLRHL